MIYISLSDYKNFGIGIEYTNRGLYNYCIKKIDFYLLFFSISFIYTKFNR